MNSKLVQLFHKLVPIMCLALPAAFAAAWFYTPPDLRIYVLPLPLPLWFAFMAIYFKSTAVRVTCICMASALLVLGMANSWFEANPPKGFSTVITGSIATNYYVPDPVRGYWSKPNVHVGAKAECDGENIYDVTYSTDSKGRRVSYPAINAKEAVVIFGCSYARGEGLNDRQTFPWLLGEASHGQYQVFNYAFHGYGPHQMLAMLEHGLDEDLSSYNKLTFIYNLIGSQVRRSAGMGKWDTDGPHYVLDGKKLYRDGTFKDMSREEINAVNTGVGNDILAKILSSSALWNRVHDAYADRLGYRAALLKSIMRRSFDLIKEKWPNSRIIVLAWPGAEPLAAAIGKDIIVAKVEPWLPNYAENEMHYRYPCDRHPNAKAAALVADGLLDVLAEN